MRRLTTNEISCKVNFAWSPGGTKIAFSGSENIWIGDIYSSELRKISFDNPKTGMLDWSADNKIVYEAEGLVIMEPDGSHEVQVATAARFPRWIDEGKILSFILPLHNKDNPAAQLWTMNAEGTEKKKFAVISGRHISLSWSKQIPFSKISFYEKK